MTRFQSPSFEFVRRMRDLIIRLILFLHDILSNYYNCKNERFELFIIIFLVYHLINQTVLSFYAIYIYENGKVLYIFYLYIIR